MPATDFQSLLSDQNVPCYLNMAPGVQNAIELALLQNIAGGIGGGSGGSPPDSTNIIEWLKADSITGINTGNPVTTWPAVIGSNGTSSGSARPAFFPALQNSLPMVRFDGAVTTMATSILGITGAVSIALAYRYQGLASAVTSIATITNTGILSTGGGQWSTDGGSSFGTVDNAFHIFFGTYVGATTKYALDGAPLTTSTGASAFSGPLNFSPLAAPSQVDIGEIIIWGVDETSNYSSIYSYMTGRWN